MDYVVLFGFSKENTFSFKNNYGKKIVQDIFEETQLSRETNGWENE